jgi:uncharacterized protein YndB with AHSA1/START domain
MSREINYAAPDRRKVSFAALKQKEQATMSTTNNGMPTTSSDSDDESYVISRVLAAPRELVFNAFAEAERLEQWWGLKGFTLRVAGLDFRPGGVCHFQLRSPTGHETWSKFTYRDIVVPERIAYVSSFTDAEGNVVRSPASASWPLEILSTATFEERAGKTTLTLRGGPFNATEVERQTFREAHATLNGRWTGTLDQLAEYLARA